MTTATKLVSQSQPRELGLWSPHHRRSWPILGFFLHGCRDDTLPVAHFAILHVKATKSVSFSPNPNKEAIWVQQANTQPPTPLFCKTIGTARFYSEAHIVWPLYWHHWPTWRGFLNQTPLPPSHMQVFIMVGKLIFYWFRICHCHVCAMNTRDVRRVDVVQRDTRPSKGGACPGTGNHS